jgi:hypothetical protein
MMNAASPDVSTPSSDGEHGLACELSAILSYLVAALSFLPSSRTFSQAQPYLAGLGGGAVPATHGRPDW